LFGLFDIDASGEIDVAELKGFVGDDGVAKAIINQLDTLNKDGKVTLDEFEEYFRRVGERGLVMGDNKLMGDEAKDAMLREMEQLAAARSAPVPAPVPTPAPSKVDTPNDAKSDPTSGANSITKSEPVATTPPSEPTATDAELRRTSATSDAPSDAEQKALEQKVSHTCPELNHALEVCRKLYAEAESPEGAGLDKAATIALLRSLVPQYRTEGGGTLDEEQQARLVQDAEVQVEGGGDCAYTHDAIEGMVIVGYYRMREEQAKARARGTIMKIVRAFEAPLLWAAWQTLSRLARPTDPWQLLPSDFGGKISPKEGWERIKDKRKDTLQVQVEKAMLEAAMLEGLQSTTAAAGNGSLLKGFVLQTIDVHRLYTAASTAQHPVKQGVFVPPSKKYNNKAPRSLLMDDCSVLSIKLPSVMRESCTALSLCSNSITESAVKDLVAWPSFLRDLRLTDNLIDELPTFTLAPTPDMLAKGVAAALSTKPGSASSIASRADSAATPDDPPNRNRSGSMQDLSGMQVAVVDAATSDGFSSAMVGVKKPKLKRRPTKNNKVTLNGKTIMWSMFPHLVRLDLSGNPLGGWRQRKGQAGGGSSGSSDSGSGGNGGGNQERSGSSEDTRVDLSTDRLALLAKNMPQLRELILARCSLQRIAVLIADSDYLPPREGTGLEHLKYLQRLDLSQNKLGGCAQIACLGKLERITDLDVSSNPVGEEEGYAEALHKLGKVISCLKILNGSENRQTWAPVTRAVMVDQEGAAIDPLAGMGGGAGDDSASCSCIEGNPCAVPYNCNDWSNRVAVAKRAREAKQPKPTGVTPGAGGANSGRISPPSGMAGRKESRLFK
jgi:Leucine-rich repeat (LRR) protein